MFRQLAKSARSGSRIPFRMRSKPSTAHILLGISGSLYYMSTLKTVHADDSNSNPHSDGQSLLSGRMDVDKVHTSAPDKEDPFKLHALSFIPSPATGIMQLDSVVVPSNMPSEDFVDSAFCQLDTGAWSFFAIFDGHNGPHTSNFLSGNLIGAVVGALADLFSKYPPVLEEHAELGSEVGYPHPPPDVIDKTIKETFVRLDNEIVNEAAECALSTKSKQAATNLLAPAHSGACAILSFYEYTTRLLRVALTGDSRAVLGRRVTDAQGAVSYEVQVLSMDQNAQNKNEEARMTALHPGEQIVADGRALGWGVSRAFGDGSYKWSREIQERMHQEFLGDQPYPNVKTPPYFTAEPEITTTDIRPGDFLVMGSDGLWDCLTNEEVVGLVVVWLTTNKVTREDSPSPFRDSVSGSDSWAKNSLTREDWPVKLKEDNTVMYRWWRAAKKFVNVDDNAAIHLARNALGGADTDLTAALLSMTPPRSRRYRDDISVNVVFFE